MASPNPGLLAALLKTGRLTGVVRWKVNLSQEALKVEAEIANYSYFFLVTNGIEDLTETISSLGNQLGLVELTRENLVSKLLEFGTTANNSNQKSILVAWSGWQDLVRNDLAGATLVIDALEQAAENWPGAVLVIDSQGNFPDLAVLTSA